jgi:hypothetical protein
MLHNYELHNLYSSPNIIRVTRSRGMKRTVHVPRMKKISNINFGYELQILMTYTLEYFLSITK